MKKLLVVASALCLVVSISASPSGAYTPPPSSSGGSSHEQAPPEMSFYNDGVKLLLKKKFAEARTQFEAALAINPKMAEAHNNLAYILRRQDAKNNELSLAHYNLALELKPKLAEAYMYRGALHYFMGHRELAQADYEMLVKLKSKLAPHLKLILDTGKEEELDKLYGVVRK